ncbi:MAG: T9SS type A sorting domain-containing protein [Calditrichaeota bacterium]|nr:T9SS type A sorting domain-containing protein [Calditrichota bacterium]
MKKTNLFIAIFAILLALGVANYTEAVPQEDVVGFWTIELQPGYNFVTFPVLPDTPTLAEVIGNQLGAVDITTWDDRIGGYRWAHYDPESHQWTGNLFLLSRGVGYWFNLIDAEEAQSLMTKGHPEVYTRFRLNQLGGGWNYYGPTIGRDQEITELSASHPGALLLSWNNELDRFDLAESIRESEWFSPEFDVLAPDQAYMVFQNDRSIRPIGPPMQLEAEHAEFIDNSTDDPSRDGGIHDEVAYVNPPWPLIVGNRDGLAVCFENGEACSNEIVLNVIRESLRIGLNGNLEPFAENIDRFEIPDGGIEPGKFRIALTVGESAQFLNPGDRVYLTVEGPRGSSTRSTSFEIPYTDDRFIPDVSFPSPLIASGENNAIAPREFAVAAPFPNPFNDRFSVEFNLPETAPVDYKMFDLQGREVYSASRPMTAGLHRLTIQANGISTGIYLLEIKAKGNRGLAKVAHVK